jgi:integrase
VKGCRPLTDEEARDLSRLLGPRDRLLVLTGLTFGLRISEALRLDFGALNTSCYHVKSAKGSDTVTFPVPKAIHRALQELEDHYRDLGVTVTDRTPLFLNYKLVKAMSRVAAWQALKKACQTLKLEGKVATHSLRKSMITKIYEMTGKDLIQTQKYSRHKSLGNLQYYIKTTESTDLVNELSWT